LNSCALTVEQVLAGVDDLGGLTMAAHVDRPTYSLLANLGFVPEGLGPGDGGLAALEISRRTTAAEFRAAHQELAHWPVVTFGDAHRLDEMRAATRFCIREPSIAELRMALCHRDGRGYEVSSISP
jgi:hypothetical protein